MRLSVATNHSLRQSRTCHTSRTSTTTHSHHEPLGVSPTAVAATSTSHATTTKRDERGQGGLHEPAPVGPAGQDDTFAGQHVLPQGPVPREVRSTVSIVTQSGYGRTARSGERVDDRVPEGLHQVGGAVRARDDRVHEEDRDDPEEGGLIFGGMRSSQGVVGVARARSGALGRAGSRSGAGGGSTRGQGRPAPQSRQSVLTGRRAAREHTPASSYGDSSPCFSA